MAGDYVITSGFETAGNTDENGWIGGWTEDALWAPVDAGSGLKWELTLGWDETKVWVTATLEDILNQYPDISIPDNINDSLESCKNAGGPDQVLACTVIRNPDLSKEDKTRIINSVAEIGYASGAMAMAFNEATMAADSIEGRLSMKAEAFNRDGSMKDGSTGLWVDVLGSWTNADSYSVSGNADIGYDADSYGIIMGVDHKLKDKNVILGGAFSYTDGNLTSTGDLLETKNAFKTFGIHAYGAWKPSDKTNLVGMLSYLRSASEASQKLPSAAGFGSASADIDTDLFVAGVRGEMLFNVSDNVQIVPHLGARMIVGSTDGYDTKLDGRKAYGNDADTTTTFQIPVGVAVRGDFVAEGGWTVRPVADLTVIPQFGDTEQDTRVTGTSGATDEVTGQFTGDFATAWIDHGRAPKQAGYEYVVYVQPSNKEINRLLKKDEYQVIRRDNTAHVVKDLPTGITGYVCFEEYAGDGLVRGVTAETIVMERTLADGQVVMSVCTPDLGLTEKTYTTRQESQPIEKEVLVGDGWELAAPIPGVEASASDAGTLLKVTCRHGQPVEFHLIKK